ncbi:MAG: hypothetical protein M1827_000101 [Pycnora praestabilis]|nr:MAG: hypothetical protein M1827_000101 [Pycnora praestabilis]
MLPPFRIRQLQASKSRSASDLKEHRLSPSTSGPDGDGVVQISAPAYDKTISINPGATLSYMDEDDGEVITVGSSLELSQRLDDHIPRPPQASTRSPTFLYPSVARLVTPSVTSTSTPLHIFDVDQSNGSLDLWRSIQQQKGTQLSRASPPPFLNGVSSAAIAERTSPREASIPQRPVDDLVLKVDHSDDLSREAELKDERKRYFRATEPSQQLLPRIVHQCRGARDQPADRIGSNICEPEQDELARETTPLLRDHRDVSGEVPTVPVILTNEGRRQARAAGEKLRSSIRTPLYSPVNVLEPDKEAHRDRWASYGRASGSLGSASDANLGTNGKAKADSSEDTHRPLLEVFETELAKLTKEGPQLAGKADFTTPITPSVSPHLGETTPRVHQQPFSPGELFTHTICSLVDGVGLLANDLKKTFPVAHEQLALAHRKLPIAVEQTLRGAFNGFGVHIQHLANSMQEASAIARQAADRTGHAELQALEGAAEGLRNLALGAGEFSRGIFAADDPSVVHDPNNEQCKPSESSNEDNSVDVNADTATARPLSDNAMSVNNPAIDQPEDNHVAAKEEAKMDRSINGLKALIDSRCTTIDQTVPSAIASAITETFQDGSSFEKQPKSIAFTDLQNSVIRKSAYTPEEYEKVHRRKREEAADKREADRQRVKKILQKAKEEAEAPIFSASSSHGVGHNEQLHEAADCTLQAENDIPTRPVGLCEISGKTEDHLTPKPLMETITSGSACQSPPSCIIGCSIGPQYHHKQCTTAHLPCPPYSALYRGRHPRRTPPRVVPRLPYEYVVPPPDFRVQERPGRLAPSCTDAGEGPPRSRSPPRHRYVSPRPHRRPPPGWPRFPRHGPIHLPHNPPQRRNQFRHPPPPPFANPRSHYPENPLQPPRFLGESPRPYRVETTSSNPAEQYFESAHEQGRPLALPDLRHRQSWHPESDIKPADRMRPSRSVVSFLESNPTVRPPPSTTSLPWCTSPVQKHHQSYTGPFNRTSLPIQQLKSSRTVVQQQDKELPSPSPVSSFMSGCDVADLTRASRDRTPKSLERRESQTASKTDLKDLENTSTENDCNSSDEESEAQETAVSSPWGYERLLSGLNNQTAFDIAEESVPYCSTLLKGVAETEEELLLSRPSNRGSDPHFQPLDADCATLMADKVADRLKSVLHDSPRSSSRHDPLSTVEDVAAQPFVSTSYSQTPEMARFPSLSQFEDNEFRLPAPFPPLPSMDPLIPSPVSGENAVPPVSTNPFSNTRSQIPQTSAVIDSSVSKSVLGALPSKLAATSTSESSGEFFRRMTKTDRTSPFGPGWSPGSRAPPPRPAKLSSPEPGARLARPFDPLAESVTLHRNRIIEGVRRSASERCASPQRFTRDRHSCSRVNLRAFWQNYENTSGKFPLDEEERDVRCQGEGENTKTIPAVEECEPTHLTDTAHQHHDVTTASRVQKCVEQLLSFGYGSSENGGAERLVIYAQAAEGDLEAAIEIIEEERNVYKQQRR